MRMVLIRWETMLNLSNMSDDVDLVAAPTCGANYKAEALMLVATDSMNSMSTRWIRDTVCIMTWEEF